MLKYISILSSFFFLSININAQLTEPVKWRYSVKQISDKEAVLIFDARIDPNWHMYSQYFPDGGPVKMSFKFSESKDFKKIGKVTESPKPKTEKDEVFEIDVQYFEGKATLSQKIQILSKREFVIKGEFEYQACFEDKCILYTPTFEFKINGAKKK
jgi:hypothetical protein